MARPPDRLIGALSLVVAVLFATWGSGPADGAGRRPTEVEVTGDPAAGTAPPAEPTTTTAATPATDAAGEPAATTTTAAPAATSSTTAGENDEAFALRMLLAPGDLPAGFVAVREAPGDGGGRDGPFERCLGPDASTLSAAVRGRARSGEFGRAGTGTVSSSSAVFDEAASAEKVMAVLGTDSARACFEGVINARLARNPNLPEDARGTLSPLDPGSFGDQSTAFRFEVNLPADDLEEEPAEEEITYVADFVFVRRDRALVLLEFGNLRRPFPPAELRAVAAALARRM